MKVLKEVLVRSASTFKLIINQILSINNFIVKPGDEDISNLFTDEKDRIKFQKKVDSMLRENIKSDTVNINNRKITISL